MRRRANTDPMCPCGKAPKAHNYGVCKDCHAERMREHRAKHPGANSVAGVHVTAADLAAIRAAAPLGNVARGKLRQHWSQKPCSGSCGGLRDVPYGAYCRACKAKYMREHRPKHSELTPEQRKRANCRSYTNTLIKRGQLKRQPCEVCGSEQVQPHHTNYDDPRAVRWRCKAHHLDEHHGPLVEEGTSDV
jgi:hypothetical protein